MKRAVLLDVSAIMYRAYYANMNFRTKNEVTGAVYGFFNTLISIINEFNPDYMAAAFDVKRSSLKRTELYDNYKNNRQSAPEELISQIPRIEELLDAFKIERFKIDGYEADDVLGSISNKLIEKYNDIEVFIVTGDKDLAQLVKENIYIALLGKGTENSKFGLLKNSDDVVEYLGVEPERVKDLFGLIGDASDGIPGVRKIGEKKALAILEKYKTLEDVYDNIYKLSEIAGIGKSLINNIVEDKDIAFMSRDLATIESKLEINFNVNFMNYKIESNQIDIEKLTELLKVLQFNSIIKKYKLKDNNKETKKQNKNNNLNLFINFNFEEENNTEKNNFINRERKIFNIQRDENIKLLEEELIKNSKIFSVYSVDEIENFNFYAISTENKDFFIHKSLASDLINLLNRAELNDKKIIVYNLKLLLKKGIIFNKNKFFDVMLAYHLVSSDTKLDVNLPIQNYGDVVLSSLKDFLNKRDIYSIDEEEISKFMLEKSYNLLKIYDNIEKELDKLNLRKVYEELEMPLIEVLNSMENEGIKIDKNYFSIYSKELEEKLIDIEKKIYFEADEEFNINSPKQLAEILFDKMNLDPIKKTKTGYSTDVSVLEELESKGIEIAKYILEHRKLNKLKSTYVDALPLLADENSLIHTNFNQIGTATGRLSSNDPNLQNIPVKTDEGIKIREGFIARENYSFMSIDYSQVELRVLASLSKDKSLLKAYKNNLDLHSLTARKIFDLKEDEEVTRLHRTMAKIINFSIIYGKTPFGLSRELGISVSDASKYINKYFEEYNSIPQFENEILDFARENSFVKTLFGRIRFINDINSKNKNIRSAAERMAINTVIQGTAAEIIKKVMLKVFDYIKEKKDIKLLLQVHDELIFEIKDNKIEEYKKDIANIMINSVKLEDINLDINISVGKNWAATK